MSCRRMLLGTDGNAAQLLGLRLFFRTLVAKSPGSFEEWEIVIVHPQYVTIDKAYFADIAPWVSLLPLLQERRPDKYYVKLLLKEYAESTGGDDDITLYLDYDHIVRSELRLPPIRGGELYVGSEIKPLSDVVDQSLFSKDDRNLLRHTHYNASLIYGTHGTFRRAMREWAELYEECSAGVATRYVEEIAFFLAAFRSGCRVTPVSLEVQSGWQTSASECSLFHYGGEDPMGIAVKQLLTRASDQRQHNASDLQNRLTFAGELLNLIREVKAD